jgi:hypothetical protein
MSSKPQSLIAVIGATEWQGGAVVHALEVGRRFKARALSRHPGQAPRPRRRSSRGGPRPARHAQRRLCGRARRLPGHEFLGGRHRRCQTGNRGGTGCQGGGRQALHLVNAAKRRSDQRRQIKVPHFTGKAKIDSIVKQAGFLHHTFVIAPMYYQSLLSALAPTEAGQWIAGLGPASRPRRALHSHGRHS